MYTCFRSRVLISFCEPPEFVREERLLAVQGGFPSCSQGGRKFPPTFTRNGKHIRRIRGSSGEHPSSSSSLIFALQAKIQFFFVKDYLDQSYKIYKGIVIIFPNSNDKKSLMGTLGFL